MSKFMAWILSATKVGKAIESVRSALWGKKTYIAGAATAVPALLTIITKFSDQGTPYLLSLPSTEEFVALMAGIGMITGRAAITKAATPTK